MAGSAKLSKVIVIVVGLKGQDKSICAVCISGESVKPTHNPSAKGEGIAYPHSILLNINDVLT